MMFGISFFVLIFVASIVLMVMSVGIAWLIYHHRKVNYGAQSAAWFRYHMVEIVSLSITASTVLLCLIIIVLAKLGG